MARDAYVSWESNRYSVPWAYAGSPVWVRARENQIEVHYGGEKIAVHPRASGKHQIITVPEHHYGIPLGTLWAIDKDFDSHSTSGAQCGRSLISGL